MNYRYKARRRVGYRVRVKIFSGHGKGKQFVNSLPPDDAIVKMLGAKPYPGTLFVQASYPLNFKGYRYQVSSNDLVRIIPGYLQGKFVIAKWTKSYPSNLQVLSDVNLREYLGLHDGQYSEIRFLSGSIIRNTPSIYWYSALQWAKGTRAAAVRRSLFRKIRGNREN